MAIYQGQSVVANPSLLSQEIYPADVYRIADSNSRNRVDGQDEKARLVSRGITNVMVEIICTEIIQPLEQIPDLATRLSKGSLDPETIGKITAIFATKFAQFSSCLGKGALGQPLQGEQLDLAQRAENLLYTGSTFVCAGKPLLKILAACVLRTRVPQLPMADITHYIGACRGGALVDAIGCRTNAVMGEIANKSQERLKAAEARLKAEQEGLRAEQEGLRAEQEGLKAAQEEKRKANQMLEKVTRELWAMRIVEDRLIAEGIIGDCRPLNERNPQKSPPPLSQSVK